MPLCQQSSQPSGTKRGSPNCSHPKVNQSQWRLHAFDREVSINRLRHQPHPECSADLGDRLEARLGIRPQGLVQGLAGNPGRLGDLGHTPRPGDVAKGSGEQDGIVVLQDCGQILGGFKFEVQRDWLGG